MPKAYRVFSYHSISDPQKFAAYAELCDPAVASFGSRFLRSRRPQRWPMSRDLGSAL